VARLTKNKTEIISFKADESLIEALSGIQNRSEFIRNALLSALDNTCPLCGGTGIVTPNQKKHLRELQEDHAFKVCSGCNEVKIVCGKS